MTGGVLLNQTDADQIATWLGEGDLTLTNIYSGTPGTGASVAWHGAVDGVGRTVSLILTELGLIGGYNPVSWTSSSNYTINPTDAGRTAFIFNLTSGLLRPQLLGHPDGQYQTLNYQGPTFGGGHDLYVQGNMSAGYAYGYTYTTGPFGPNLFGVGGGTTYFNVLRVETFTIANGGSGVPEPSTWLLCGAALVALGLWRRRQGIAARP